MKNILVIFFSFFSFFSCKTESKDNKSITLKKDSIIDKIEVKKNRLLNEEKNSQINVKYLGNFTITLETEATTTGMASLTYSFLISKEEAELKIISYHESLNCDGNYNILEKNNTLELYYNGETEYCKTKEPNFKLKKEGNKFFMKGLGGEATFNEWIEVVKK
ncbi:MAG: hypothetical protein HC854_13390 [Flavobacterium sp.]|nr:hypothetical protein [Flavobacterium sp.]